MSPRDECEVCSEHFATRDAGLGGAHGSMLVCDGCWRGIENDALDAVHAAVAQLGDEDAAALLRLAADKIERGDRAR